MISAQRAGELFPLLRTDDLHGGIWIPGDGKANPADLTMSLAKGARNRGVRIVEGVEVTGVLTRGATARVTGVRVRHGGESATSPARSLVNCAGQWARQFGAPGRRQRAALFGRALLHRHRPHRGRAPDAAGDARPRRLHLLQGRGRRPGDGRLRAEGQAVDASIRSRRPSASSCSARTGTSSSR